MGRFLGYVGRCLCSEVLLFRFAGSVFMLLVQLVGVLIGYWFVFVNTFGRVWLSVLCGSDVFVDLVYGWLSKFFELFVLVIYRWEFGLLS